MAFNFGGNNNSGDKKPFSFGNTSTPSQTAPTNLFGNLNTTTPAGPPPATTGFSFGSTTQTATPTFGTSNSNVQKPLFGNADTGTKTQANTGFAFGSNTQSGQTGGSTTGNTDSKPSFSFGATTSTTPAQTPAPANPGGFSFGNTGTQNTPTTSSGLFASTAPSTTTQTEKPPGNFSFGNNTTTSTATPTLSTPAPAGGFTFGGTNPISTSKPAAAATSVLGDAQSTVDKPSNTTPSTGAFSFGAKPSDNGPQSTQADAGQTTSTGFSFGGAAKDNGAARPIENKPSGGFSFGNSTKPEAVQQDKSKAAITPTAPTFGTAKTDDKKSDAGAFSFGGSKVEAGKEQASTTTDGKNIGSTLTTNTTTAAPPPASLKNKTMEDLINKWSGDLDKYSQDFQKQAKQISTWDQALLKSGDQISRLYAATVEAEQQSGKVDQALNYIENQQDELSQILDSYEAQVRDITAEARVTQPADQERERAYSQAEKLVGELDGLGKNLSAMITELNKNGEVTGRLTEDDPLTSIIKILNSQLQSLTWIDENATKLNEKVEQLKSLKTNESPRTPTGNKFRFGSLRLE